jgi:hypothetical protein
MEVVKTSIGYGFGVVSVIFCVEKWYVENNDM